MTKKQALTLYLAIRDLKSGDMEKTLLYKYAKARVELRKIASDYESFRSEVGTTVNIKDALELWLSEPAGVAPVFAFEDVVDLCQHNDAVGEIQDVMLELMTIKE